MKDQHPLSPSVIISGIIIAVVAAIIIGEGRFAPPPNPTVANPTPTAYTQTASIPSQSTITPLPSIDIPRSSPTLHPTSAPLEETTTLVESGDNYRIEQVSNGQTGAKIVIKASPDFPLNLLALSISPAVRDIANNWQYAENFPEAGTFPSPQGTLEQTLKSGDYILSQSHIAGNTLTGHWGNASFGYVGLVFPVRDGWTTIVTVIISKLQIGVLDPTRSYVPDGLAIELHCQGKNIAGKIISEENCDGATSVNKYGIWQYLDKSGITAYYTGPGTYFVGVYDLNQGYKWYYDIEVQAGEEKQLIFTYP